jgi:hypothetical protein
MTPNLVHGCETGRALDIKTLALLWVVQLSPFPYVYHGIEASRISVVHLYTPRGPDSQRAQHSLRTPRCRPYEGRAKAAVIHLAPAFRPGSLHNCASFLLLSVTPIVTEDVLSL